MTSIDDYIFDQHLQNVDICFSTQTVSVLRPSRRARVPVVGTIVIGLVTKLNKLQASLSINAVEGIPLPLGQEFLGVIRSQDVRQVEKDKVKIWTCFRPGDIVRAEVVSSLLPSLRALEDVVGDMISWLISVSDPTPSILTDLTPHRIDWISSGYVSKWVGCGFCWTCTDWESHEGLELGRNGGWGDGREWTAQGGWPALALSLSCLATHPSSSIRFMVIVSWAWWRVNVVKIWSRWLDVTSYGVCELFSSDRNPVLILSWISICSSNDAREPEEQISSSLYHQDAKISISNERHSDLKL